MNPTSRYSHIAITLHWVIAILLVGMVFYGWYMEGVRDALFAGDATLEDVRSVYNTHKTVGLVILVLSLGRLAWRLTHPVPAMPEGMKPWERMAAHATHWTFYAIMIGMPIGGWVAASSSEEPSWLLNNPDLVLPRLPVPQSEGFHELAGSAHGAGGWVILILLGLHVAAALKHQFLDGDNLLARMLPFLKGSKG